MDCTDVGVIPMAVCFAIVYFEHTKCSCTHMLGETFILMDIPLCRLFGQFVKFYLFISNKSHNFWSIRLVVNANMTPAYKKLSKCNLQLSLSLQHSIRFSCPFHIIQLDKNSFVQVTYAKSCTNLNETYFAFRMLLGTFFTPSMCVCSDIL